MTPKGHSAFSSALTTNIVRFGGQSPIAFFASQDSSISMSELSWLSGGVGMVFS